jgi:hypothetical protein
MVTSRQLADVVGDALGIARPSAQLHLKTIRADGQILFEGYGRAAAEMSALDAARLVIAVAGSTFAKDSANVLRRFGHLKVPGSGSSAETLELCLKNRIDELPLEVTASRDQYRNRGRRRWGSPRLADVALQLFEPIGNDAAKEPRFAIVRWITHQGDSPVRLFVSPGHPRIRFARPNDPEKDRAIHDLVEVYSGPQLFQARIVGRSALIEIGAALKGLPIPYGSPQPDDF